MTLQNRVLPDAEIVADPHRGTLMGNRGCIHRADRQLGVARWRTKMWISCVLDWRGRRRDVMPPGRWTALFFLDEVTALSAGHRPCGYCRRGDHLAFGEAWRRGHGLARRLRAAQMDVVLHAQRVDRHRHKIRHERRMDALPDGSMVVFDPSPAEEPRFALVSGRHLLPWSPSGYLRDQRIARDTLEIVQVLTPPAILAALQAGYRPMVHRSAGTTSLRGQRDHPARVS